MDLRILGSLPETAELADALDVAAKALGRSECWAVDGRYHFTLSAGWSVALSSDSARRIRVDLCLRSAPRVSMWCMAANPDRLSSLVVKMANQAAEPV